MEEKKEFRNIYKTRRNGMSRREVDALSARICARLTDSALFLDADCLYGYYPLGNEADVRPAIQAAWQLGKRVAFPKVSGETMGFFEVANFGQLAEGTFGVMEPQEDAGAVPVDWLRESGGDMRLLVLVPGVAFDRAGNRMGRGKGYYDRHFAECAVDRRAEEDAARTPDGVTLAGVTLAGVAFAAQIADSLPVEAHDLTVSYLITEEGLFPVRA